MNKEAQSGGDGTSTGLQTVTIDLLKSCRRSGCKIEEVPGAVYKHDRCCLFLSLQAGFPRTVV